jgi:TolA-binding protein
MNGRRIGLLLGCTLLGGCSMFNFVLDAVGLGDGSSRRVVAQGPTVGDVVAALPPVAAPVAAGPAATVAASGADAPGNTGPAATAPARPVLVDAAQLEAAIANYASALPAIDDADVARAVRKRLLDLELEARSLAADAGAYAGVIAGYEQLLAERPPGDIVLGPSATYQLARARDLAGEGERSLGDLDALIVEGGQTPEARALVQEANFRRGEAAFSRGDWAVAATHFAAATAPDSPIHVHATYMLGWAQYRNGNVDAALDAFLDVVGAIADAAPPQDAAAAGTATAAEAGAVAAGTPAGVDAGPAGATTDGGTAAGAGRSGGTDAVDRQGAAGPGASAGDDLVAALAPGMRELLTDALRACVLTLERAGGVPVLVARLGARGQPAWQYVLYAAVGDAHLRNERFQDAAAVHDAFVAANPLDVRAPAFALRAIDALADGALPAAALERKAAFVERYGRGGEFHAATGDLAFARHEPALRAFIGELAARAHAQAQQAGGPGQGGGDYREAARWYRAWLANFDAGAATGAGDAGAAAVADTLFLLGEALAAAGDHAPSVEAFAALARRFPAHERAREAAYAVVLGTQALAAADPARAADLLAAELAFAAAHRDDARAPVVQLHAAQALLTGGEHARAAVVAEESLSVFELTAAQALAARRIAADARFALDEFAAAEAHYRGAAPQASGDERAAIDARIVASMFEQARRAESAGEVAGAVGHLERLAAFAPGSEQALRAGLDRAALLVGAGDLAAAAAALASLRDAYPGHALLADVDVRLADLYERQQRPADAAAALLRVADASDAAQAAATALYHAAELYRAANDADAERAALERYVREHPRPMPLAVEAQARLLELVPAAADQATLRRQLLALHAADAAAATPRTRFLAAAAAFALADVDRAAFEALPLAQPLRQSLAAKRQALDDTLAAYERASGFGAAEFVAGAAFRIAGLHAHMHDAVLGVQPPAGLSDAARATYVETLSREAAAFAARAVVAHEANAARAREGVWNDWIVQSFAALAALSPERHRRTEVDVDIVAMLP